MSKKKKYRNSSQPKDMLSKGTFFKTVIIPVLFVAVLSIGYLFWYTNNRNSVATNVEYIRGFMTKSGTFNDYQNKLACKGLEDIRFYDDEKGIQIDVGRIVLDWPTKEEFLSEETQSLIGTIGFSTKVDKQTGKIVLYWAGSEVTKWAR